MSGVHGRDTGLPGLVLGHAAAARLAPRGEDVLGYLERRVRPAQILARGVGVLLEARPLWAARVPSTPGMPRPMVVVQAIIDGRGSALAAVMAAAIASASCPSTAWTCQLLARNRAAMSSDSARSMSPSSVMRLSSHRKVSLPSRR